MAVRFHDERISGAARRDRDENASHTAVTAVHSDHNAVEAIFEPRESHFAPDDHNRKALRASCGS